MTETVAAERLLADLRTLAGMPVALARAEELGAGGEARVFVAPGDPRRVVKLYREPGLQHARKLAQMLAAPPVLDAAAGVRLAWPEEPLVDGDGRLVGFVMPRATGSRVFEVYNPATRRALEARFHWGLLHRAGANLATAFAALHARGYLVGDVNESNILVAPDGGITLVDTDGFQVPDPLTGRVFRSRVGRPEYTPPELHGVDFGEVDRTELHDRFGLGVLLFLLLMEGTHPFAVRLDQEGEAPPVEERIRAGLFPHAGDLPGIREPRLSPPFEALHPALREQFLRCFKHGHTDPAARPAATEWRAALLEAEADLAVCTISRQHLHASHLPACPWCRRARLLGGRDPFPARPVRARPGQRVVQPPAPAPPKSPGPISSKPAFGGFHRASYPPQSAFRDPATWLLPLLTLAVTVDGARPILLICLMFLIWRTVEYRAPRRWRKVLPVSGGLTLLALTFTVRPDPGYSGGTATVDVGQPIEALRSDVGPLPNGVEIRDVVLLPPLSEGAMGSEVEPAEIGTLPEVLGADQPAADLAWGVAAMTLPERTQVIIADVTVGADGRVVPASIVVRSTVPEERKAVDWILPHIRFRPGRTTTGYGVVTRIRVPLTFDPAGVTRS